MQTFIPFFFYSNCAKALDNKRLNKQQLECFHLITLHKTQVLEPM